MSRIKNGLLAATLASAFSNATSPGRKMGAALLSGNRVLSIGWNLFDKTHPLSKWTIHAEQMAMIRRRHHEDSNLWLAIARQRYGKNGETTPGVSRPCPMCMELIRIARIQKIAFYDENGQITVEKVAPFFPRISLTGGY